MQQSIPLINSSSLLPPLVIAPQHRLLARSSHPPKANPLAAAGFHQPKRSVCFRPAASPSGCSLISRLAPLEAALFDIDGTLCDSDPIHFCAFREVLMQIGFNSGVPITEEFYSERISGRHNDDIARSLFPEWDEQQTVDFVDKKEALFRRLAPGKLQAVDGLHKLCSWIDDHGLKRGVVSNAPRANAELMLSLLGLTDFFQVAVLAGDCDRAKPFPDAYLKALEDLGASPGHALVFEDSASGIEAGVAAGMPVIGLTTRNPPQQLADAGAALLIQNFEDPRLWKNLQESVAI